MNCKPGDMAVYVRSDSCNLGKIVRVLRFVGKVDGWTGDDRWLTDSLQVGAYGGRTNTARDSNLRPIRDPGDDATDETLLWLPSPSRTKEEA
jgi:hypothetical protein